VYIINRHCSNGQFEETTDTDENVFVKDGVLTIKPTLQDPKLLESDQVYDIRDKGCTGPKWTDCVAVTNTTNGTIINPVKSGRINTKLGASIKFGRVEVTAKLPHGDWLWPAIWMLPRDNVYGQWPRSGEIDIMESRGNNYSYANGGNNIASSTLHFGPDSENDGWWRNNVKRKALHTTYAAGFNTFGVEVGTLTLIAWSLLIYLSGAKSISSRTLTRVCCKSCTRISMSHFGAMANSLLLTPMARVSRTLGSKPTATLLHSIKSSILSSM
jgi:hypothetical protein